MYYVSKSINNMDALLIKKEKELERKDKILADHNERIRILELAIQRFLTCSIKDENEHLLNNAITESHKIALKEYP